MPRQLRAKLALALACATLILARPARAYETDQLTRRDEPLADILPLANQHMDDLLAEAVTRTNRRTGCHLDVEATRQMLARQILRLAGGNATVPDRGLVRQFGFTRYAAWIERQDIGRRGFLDRDDIFSDLSFWQSPVLRAVGPAGTVLVAGTLMGTDKFDHFFELGYDYYVRSGWGEDPESARAFGTATERTYLGLLTSRTFSFADLAANEDGYEFFSGLLDPGSELVLDGEGCVVQSRPWDWAEIVSWEWDEVQNPSVFVPVVQGSVAARLLTHKDEVCASYAKWGSPAYLEHLSEVLDAWPPYVVGAAPARSDPFQLERLCEGDPVYGAGRPWKGEGRGAAGTKVRRPEQPLRERQQP